jgi:ribose transport system permease protein
MTDPAIEPMTDPVIPEPVDVETESAPTRGRQLPTLSKGLVLLIVLIAEIVLFSLLSPYFLGWTNFLNTLDAVAVIGIVAAPGTLLIVAGQFDLSVGSITALSGIAMASIAASHGLTIGVLAALGIGIGAGAVNGYFVTVVGINPLITTLATLSAFQGLAEVTSNGLSLSVNNFGGLGTATIGANIQVPVVILVVVMIVFAAIMRFTVFGRTVYAIGANPVAARLIGLRTKRTIFILFVISGLACALSGLILNSQLASASPTAATGLELSVITAVVLGGATLSGGEGTVLGTALGILVIGVLNDGLVLKSVNPFWQDVAQGALLIAAVSFDRVRARLVDRR